LELKDIKAIIDLMKKHDLAVFTLEREGFKLHLEAKSPPIVTQTIPQVLAAPLPVMPPPHGLSPSAVPATPPTEEKGREIVSPMVGTFYRAASPDSAPFVQVGHEIVEDTVVCIIEAMKVMNEIKAEVHGVISEVLVENGTPVQFGQSLFRVK
jgi:acetyl-CoA carboxylase biotin carboxyl carrier protein